MSDVTRLLEAARHGDPQAAADLLPLVYGELRQLAAVRMAAEAPGHTLDATALVHEAYLRLVGDQQFDGRGHFFAAAAEAMRRILIESARRKHLPKHGGRRRRVDLDEAHSVLESSDDLLLLDDALSRLVRGELDWIVLKALAKERDRRYETASGFARDVERFLNHEPVSAGPPGWSYRLRKFVRRNRPQVIAAGLVLLALLAGFVGTTLGLIRAEERRQEADQARQREQDRADGEVKAKDAAVRAARAEKAAREEEEREREYAQAIAAFVKDDLLALTSVARGRSASAALGWTATPRCWSCSSGPPRN